MECKKCIYFDNSYFPNRCYHDFNCVYLEEGGMYCKRNIDELNPKDNCNIGEEK